MKNSLFFLLISVSTLAQKPTPQATITSLPDALTAINNILNIHTGQISTLQSTSATSSTVNGASYSGNALVVYDGNSLWQGTGSSHLASSSTDFAAGPFPSRTRTVLNSQFPSATFTSYNFGVAGQTTAQMLSDVQTQTDVLFSPSTFDRQIVVCGEITNQLANGSGFTAQQAIDNYVVYCKGRRAKGFLVVATTVLTRTAGFTGISAADFETARVFINNYLRLNYLQFSDVLADIANVPGVTYPDGIHPNDAGYILIGNYVAAKVAPLLITGFNPQSIAFLLTGSAGSSTTVTGGSSSTVASSVLLQLNGSLADASSFNRTVTNNNVVSSTAQSKYGGSSLLFNSTDSYLTVPNTANLNLGTSDFTMELWVYPTANPNGYPGLLSRGDWSEIMWTFVLDEGAGGRPEFFVRTSGNYNSQSVGAGSGLTLNTWSHIALVSVGGVRKLYTNGTLTNTSSVNTTLESTNANKQLIVGVLPNLASSAPTGEHYVGYMHLRFSNVALYTANFTPPTSF